MLHIPMAVKIAAARSVRADIDARQRAAQDALDELYV
jgi:Holliday junction resolvase RusA-like endonuclease